MQPALKTLGYAKLGERARLIAALKAAPTAALDVSDAASPSAAPSAPDEPVLEGDATMVMHATV